MTADLNPNYAPVMAAAVAGLPGETVNEQTGEQVVKPNKRLNAFELRLQKSESQGAVTISSPSEKLILTLNFRTQTTSTLG
jgi:hypothetical protein